MKSERRQLMDEIDRLRRQVESLQAERDTLCRTIDRLVKWCNSPDAYLRAAATKEVEDILNDN